MKLTDRDTAILRTLTAKVRLLTARQVAEAWWPSSSCANVLAARRLRALLAEDLLYVQALPAHPMLDLAAPVHTWQPGQPDPDAQALSYRLIARWPQEYLPTTVYLASRRTVNLFGSLTQPRVRHPDQVTHDLHLSGVYLKFRREQPELADAWVGEDELAPERRHQKLPDAVIKDPTGAVRLVIEFGGKYDAPRFADFHADCKRRQLPYQLW